MSAKTPTTAPKEPMITAACPTCGHLVEWRARHQGKRARCPKCDAVYAIEPVHAATQAALNAAPITPTAIPVPDGLLDPETQAALDAAEAVHAQLQPTTAMKKAAALKSTPVANPPRTIGLQITGAVLFMGGLAAGAIGLGGPSDIQLLGFWSIGASLVSGGIVVSAIARAIQVLSR